MYYIEVAYYEHGFPLLCGLQVLPGATIQDCLALLKLTDFTYSSLGIRGRQVSLNYVVKDEDRIELYLPLFIDIKERRRGLARE